MVIRIIVKRWVHNNSFRMSLPRRRNKMQEEMLSLMIMFLILVRHTFWNQHLRRFRHVWCLYKDDDHKKYPTLKLPQKYVKFYYPLNLICYLFCWVSFYMCFFLSLLKIRRVIVIVFLHPRGVKSSWAKPLRKTSYSLKCTGE